MPLYDYKCRICGHEFEEFKSIAERNDVACPHCFMYESAKIQISPNIGASVFRAGYYDNIAADPIHCETPQQLREACDKYGGISRYLQEGIWRTSQGRTLGEAEGEDKYRKGREGGKGREEGSSSGADGEYYTPVRGGRAEGY